MLEQNLDMTLREWLEHYQQNVVVEISAKYGGAGSA